MSLEESVVSVIDYYNNYNEKNRLKTTYRRLEFAHMTELLMRYFPKPPAKICDIGGANGDYAFYFSKLGYDAHLLDIVPRLLIKQKNVLRLKTMQIQINS